MYPLFNSFPDADLRQYMAERKSTSSMIDDWERLDFSKKDPDILGQQDDLRIYTKPKKQFSVLVMVKHNLISIKAQAIGEHAELLPKLKNSLDALEAKQPRFLQVTTLPPIETLKENAYVLHQQEGCNSLYYANVDEHIYTPSPMNDSQETKDLMTQIVNTHDEKFVHALRDHYNPRLNDYCHWSMKGKNSQHQMIFVSDTRSFSKLKVMITAFKLPPEITHDIQQYIDGVRNQFLCVRKKLINTMSDAKTNGMVEKFDSELGLNGHGLPLPDIAQWCADRGEKEIALRLAVIIHENNLDPNRGSKTFYYALLKNNPTLLKVEEERLLSCLTMILQICHNNPEALYSVTHEAMNILNCLPKVKTGAVSSVQGPTVRLSLPPNIPASDISASSEVKKQDKKTVTEFDL